MIWTIAKKELRGYFNSAVAVIFLAAFLAVTLYTFFWREHFFARGLADVRPLFEWLPKLLSILVAALAMRLWADERRAGTLEVLLTLPVPRWRLVAGKFVAGMLLIGIGLVLTLGLPITISMMGHLDWGPVIGGYLAALLLSAAYLAIGMCVSAATDNQIVAFVGTALACGIAYAVGDTGGDLGRALGTGARFESVARGVLDLRDLAYYGGIVVAGVAVNVLLLGRLSWSRGPRARQRRVGTLVAVGLVIANALALNLWLSQVHRARIDLTQDGTYSLSSSTRKIVGGLDERMLIRGYFSEKTHPKLAPLIPQIRDLLEEYRVAGGGKLRVEIVDPTDSDDAKREAKERFDINPTPLRFATQTEKSIVDAYFAIAIAYGDQHEVLNLDELIQVRSVDVGEVEITLKNLEYQLTKSIKKSISSFSSVDALFASMPGKVEMTTYLTPTTLPDNWKAAPATLAKVVEQLTKQAGGKLAATTVEPKGDDQMRDLFAKYGLRPYQDLASGQVYYFHIVLRVGNRIVRIQPPEALGEEGLKSSIVDGLKRAAPGFTRVVGLWSPPGDQRTGAQGPQPGPPPQAFQTLRRSLGGNYEVRDIHLDMRIPDEMEVVVLGGPANLTPSEVQMIDQFVMRGGSLVVLAGRYRLAPSTGTLAIEKVTTGLEPMFAKWGITLGEELVLDAKSDAFPIPENRDLGNGTFVREIRQLPYPFFVKIDGDRISSSSVITSGSPGAVLHWGTWVKAEGKVGDDVHTVEPLLSSSADSWLTTSTSVEPNLAKFPKTGFAPPADSDKKESRVMALAVTGGFATSGDAKGAQHSPPDTRIVVFGASAFVTDDVLGLAQQLDSELATSNVELVHAAVDWALADTDLLTIRSHTSAQRAIKTAPEDRETYRTANVAIAVIGLGLLVGLTWFRRRSVTPVVTGKEA